MKKIFAALLCAFCIGQPLLSTPTRASRPSQAGDWEKFDSAAASLEEGAEKDAGVQYLRALETLRRVAIKKDR